MAKETKPAKPFIWLGPGVLWLDTGNADNPRIVVHPKGFDDAAGKEFTGIVRKPENLVHIGHDRVEQLVAERKAKYISIVDQVIDGVKGLEDSADQQTPEDQVVTTSVLDSQVIKANADTGHAAEVGKAVAGVAAQPKVETPAPKTETSAAAGPK